MQVGAIAIGVAAQGAARQPVERVVAKALGVAGPAKGAGGRTIAARIARGGSGPRQPVLLVVAEELVVRACGQDGGDSRDIAHRVVVDLLVIEHSAGVDLDQIIRHQPSIAIQLGGVVVEGGSGGLADVGAGDGPEGARWSAVAHRRQDGSGRSALCPVHPGESAVANC